MELREVRYEDLSSITHTTWLSEPAGHRAPEFLVVKYSGVYRPGSRGHTDATYIEATLEAARKAWDCQSLILDFTNLEYVCGDEMTGVFCIGWTHAIQRHFPLAVIVGERCRDALASLLLDAYDGICGDDLAAAVELARRERARYEEAWQAYHRKRREECRAEREKDP